MKRLTRGNKKVNAWLFSMPPIKACPNCHDCASTCYATKAYRQYPGTRKLWDKNFEDATTDLETLYNDLDKQLEEISKRSSLKTVRIHQSGDFISSAYIRMWCRLVSKYPGIHFYAYTKVYGGFRSNLNELDSKPNVNIIPSFVGGKLNYGPPNYVKRLEKEYNAFICPATEKGSTVRCGVECDYCFYNKDVVFIQH
jgi:hypothetical protein